MVVSLLALLLILAATGAAQGPVVQEAVRDPDHGPDGRLVLEINGDLWLARAGGERSRLDDLAPLTAGPAWDRQPAWTPDGRSVVFSSDRGGSQDLWSVGVDDDGARGDPVRITDAMEPDTEPAVAADGTIVFVRGRGAVADLWVVEPDREPRRLHRRDGVESSPTWSPEGDRIAYVGGGQVRVLEVSRRTGDTDPKPGEGDEAGEAGEEPAQAGLSVTDDSAVAGTAGARAVDWSPEGSLLAFSRSRGAEGVFVTPADGDYANRVVDRPASISWSPGAGWLALAELPPPGPGYNGDPDRLGDRSIGDVFPQPEGHGRFWLVRAPRPLPTLDEGVEVAAEIDRARYNAEAFDRVWERLAALYFDEPPRRDAWEDLRDELRPRAVAAGSVEAVEEVVHELLRRRPPARDEAVGRAAVSSAHPLATAAGVEILEKGGNVVDAAVAVSFALGVVEPDASGIGGYGQMVLSLVGMESPTAIEFLTRVPEDATLDNAALRDPTGPMLANVPGTVRGMELAWKEYGSGEIEWAELIAPAIRIAEEGFVLDDAFTTTLVRERERFTRWESSRELFFPEGEPLAAGDRFDNPDLAWTLRQIAEGGADAFYEGEVAERIVRDLRGRGNAVTLHDMARYFAVERRPVAGTYRGHSVYSAAPAVSGGVSLVAKLHLLDNTGPFGLYTDDPAALHALIEAWKLQPSARGKVADPSLWPVDVESVIDREAARSRWSACFDPGRATTADDLDSSGGGDPACLREQEKIASVVGEEVCMGDDCRSTGTTAFAVGDAEGNLVAVTQTLGTWGGNFYVTPGLGFLYNDKLRSYGSDPDRYGARLPYARNSTSIAPTLVFRGTGDDREPLLAVGAAGNAWITSAVYQTISGIIDGGLGPQGALELPRFLVSRGGFFGGAAREPVVQIEDAIAPSVLRGLRSMGHEFQTISLRGELRMGYGAAVMVDGNGVRAGADPRRSGAAQALGPANGSGR